jgi:hypothetical protein
MLKEEIQEKKAKIEDLGEANVIPFQFKQRFKIY